MRDDSVQHTYTLSLTKWHPGPQSQLMGPADGMRYNFMTSGDSYVSCHLDCLILKSGTLQNVGAVLPCRHRHVTGNSKGAGRYATVALYEGES